MLIAISGTPGTGKTAVAKILSKKTGARLITTGFLAKKYKIKAAFDKKRKTKIIDTKKLAAAAEKESSGKNSFIFEGHLSHFSDADFTIILRTSPAELAKRLKRKGWNDRKMAENIEAEAMGIISGEAKNAVEIDTTKKTPRQTAGLIARMIRSKALQRKYSKRIDWMEAYVKFLG